MTKRVTEYFAKSHKVTQNHTKVHYITLHFFNVA